eukprot:jgi/Tetstr1/431138/TSEL_020852.t1
MGQYSLWIEPTGQLAEQLQAEIERLRAEHSGPCFAPHVTLAAFTAEDDAAAEAITAKLVATMKPYHLTFIDVSYGAIFHQCVFLLCAKDAAVMDAAAAAKAALGLPESPYMPHLSLLYADIDEATRAQVAGEMQQRLYGESQGYDTLLVETGFQASGIALWRTDGEDRSLESWTRLGRFAFGGAA